VFTTAKRSNVNKKALKMDPAMDPKCQHSVKNMDNSKKPTI